MKKIVLCIMVACLTLTFQPLQSKTAANAASSSTSVSKPAEAAEAKALLNRLNEIKLMDKSTLNSSEKKNLRMEVLTIKHRLNSVGGGVYLSAGAIIIIILLLIILL